MQCNHLTRKRALTTTHPGRRTWLLLLGLALLGLALGKQAHVVATKAALATITVNSTATTTVNGDGKCTLLEALNNANNDSQGCAGCATDCAAGMAGLDTITLPANATITLTAVNNSAFGDNGLPRITSPISVQGNNATLTRGAAAPAFRFFQVRSTGNLTLTDLTISNGSSSGLGGAILNLGGSVTLTNATFTGNQGAGGGAYADISGSSLMVTGSLFTNNSASSGGAIYSDGNFSISNSLFRGNTANSYGGAIRADYSISGTIENSTFSDNRTTFVGGALYTGGGINLTITNSTFAANSARTSGGAIEVSMITSLVQSAVTITNSTIAGNSASRGSGLYAFDDTITLRNTIVANNTGGAQCATLGSGVINAGADNLQFPGPASCGTSTVGDPLLGPLQYNGGPAAGAPGTREGIPTLRPLPGSAALDTATAACPPADQRVVLRPQGAACDKGAVEVTQFAGTTFTLTTNPATNPTLAVTELIDALNQANANPDPTTINLVCGTYTLTARDNTFYGFTGLPVITTPVIIEGNGAVIERAASAPTFRLLAVARQDPQTGQALTTPGSLRLRQVTLRGGLAQGGQGGDAISSGGGGGAGLGGAVYNGGTLTIEQSALVQNTAQGGRGGNSDVRDGAGGGGGGLGGNGGARTHATNAGSGGGGFGGNGGLGAASTGDSGGGEGGGRVANGNAGTGNTGGSGGSAEGGDGSNVNNDGNPGGFGGGGGGSGGGDGGGGSVSGVGGGGGGAGLGGAVFNDGGTLVVTNSTLSGNQALGGQAGTGSSGAQGQAGQGLGGGIFARNGTVTINHATLNNNSVTNGAGAPIANGGGALYLLSAATIIRPGDSTAVTFTITNSIFANTTPTNTAADAFVNAGATPAGTGNNNLVEFNGSDPAGADANDLPGVTQTADPQLGALSAPLCQATGCRTPVHPLTTSSPAFNAAGNNAEGVDLCGTTRPQVGADIGAYELPCVPGTAQVSGGGAIRPGQTATVTVTVSSGTATYTITLTNNGGMQTGTGPVFNFAVSPTSTTTYSVESATGAGCPLTRSGSAMVTVDNTPPIIACPANGVGVIAGTTGPVTYPAPSVSDNRSGATFSCTPASGATFALGTTTVNCTATDAVGNTAACSFTVTVRQVRPAIKDLIKQVQALVPPLTQAGQLISPLERATSRIERGEIAAGCAELQTFVTRVNGFIANGGLTTAQGQALLSYANKIRNAVGCAGNPFPI